MVDCYLTLSNDIYDQLHLNFCSYLRKCLLLYFSNAKFSVMYIDHDLTMIHCHYSIVVAVVII